MNELLYYHDLNIPPDEQGYNVIYVTPEEALSLKPGDTIKIGHQSIAEAEVIKIYACLRVKRGDLIYRYTGYHAIHDEEHKDYHVGCPWCEKRSGEV